MDRDLLFLNLCRRHSISSFFSVLVHGELSLTNTPVSAHSAKIGSGRGVLFSILFKDRVNEPQYHVLRDTPAGASPITVSLKPEDARVVKFRSSSL